MRLGEVVSSAWPPSWPPPSKREACLAAASAVSMYVVYKWLTAPKLPPGPRPLPIVGNFLSLMRGKTLYWQCRDWSQIYGPLVTIDFSFFGKAVVINDYELVKEAFVDRGMALAGRPLIASLDLFTDGGKDIAFGQPDEDWVALRKLAYKSFKMVASGQSLMRHIEVAFEKLEEELRKVPEDTPFNPRNAIRFAIFNFIMRATCNKTYDSPEDEEFKFLNSLNREGLEQLGSGLLGDFIPALRFLPTPGTRWVQNSLKRVKVILSAHWEEHQRNFDKHNINDIMDCVYHHLFEMCGHVQYSSDGALAPIDQDRLLQLFFDVIGAGTDTSVDVLNWVMLLACLHPEEQEGVHRELTSVLQPGESPSFMMREQLPRTEAFFLEVLRYAPVAPMAIPHLCIKQTTLAGYTIPKGVQVWANIMALHRDPRYWPDADTFNPSRFLDGEGKVRHNMESYLPFSIGRRVCVGESIARPELFTLIALLLLKFNIYYRTESEKPTEKVIENFLVFVPDDSYRICIKPR